MSRQRSTKRKKALKLWIDSGRRLTARELGERIDVSPALIRKWKHEDNWDEEPDKRPRGAQPGNQNAVGNSGGPGGPIGNDKNLKHGAYSRFLPRNERFQELLAEVQEMEPLDMLWNTIEIAYAKLLWSQEIMFVESKDDMTKEISKMKEASGKNMESVETQWDIQYAWDKQKTDISAYATINRELRGAIKQFIAVAPERDERRAKLEQMAATLERTKAQTEKLKPVSEKKNKRLEDWLK